MASSVTTAMLALPNDSLGRGVVACYPLEETSGTTLAEVSTTANASFLLTWRGVWSTAAAYSPRDIVIISGTPTQAWVCTAPVAAGGIQPGTATTNDNGNWCTYGVATFTWVGTWVSGSSYSVNQAVIGPNGGAYRCTTAVSGSSTPPASDTSKWAAVITTYSLTHGYTLTIGAATPNAVTGGSAVASGAAASLSVPASTAQAGIPYRNGTKGNPYDCLGTSASLFVIVKFSSTSFAANATVMRSGNLFLRMISSGRLTGYAIYNVPGTANTAVTLGASAVELVQAGTYSVEVRWDGYALSVIVNGELRSFQMAGLNGPSNTPLPLSTLNLASLCVGGDPSFLPANTTQFNNFLVLNRALDRDEHRALAIAAGVTVATLKMPMRNRAEDAYSSAVSAASLASRGCAECGGNMADNEPSVTADGRKVHPGCYALTGQASFKATSTYADIAVSAGRMFMACLEAYSTGSLQYHDGTKFFAQADGLGQAVGANPTGFQRNAASFGGDIALIAKYFAVPYDHWIWHYVRKNIEQVITWQAGGAGLVAGDTSIANVFPSAIEKSYGAISPNIMTSPGKYVISDASYSTFILAELCVSVLAMKPYLKRREPQTWARWEKFIVAAGHYMWQGYIAPGAPNVEAHKYVPNGNWAINNAAAFMGVYRVTGDQIWYNRYKEAIAYAINPLKDSVSAQALSLVNALGSFTPRGFWSAANTYTPGDLVAVPYGYGGPSVQQTQWRGYWQAGVTYAAGERVKDTSVSSGGSMYFYAKSAVTSTTPPSQDTTNWTFDFPGDWQEYVCIANAAFSANTPPYADTTRWEASQRRTNRTYHHGFMGLHGVAGSDTTNWTDYKCFFSEWKDNSWAFLGPPGEMQGLPGYDGNYTAYQDNVVQLCLILMGGINKPHPSVQQAEWRQMVNIANGITNQMLQYATPASYTYNGSSGAAGGYSTRQAGSAYGFTSAYHLAAIANGTRTDIASAYPVLTPYNWAQLMAVTPGLTNLFGWSVNAYGFGLTYGLYCMLDPAASQL